MCATPSPKVFTDAETEPPPATNGGATVPWKPWVAPAHAVPATKAELGPINRPPSARWVPGSGEERRQPIYGIGRNYNRVLGVSAYRTGASIMLDCSLASTLSVLQRNIESDVSDPCSTLRLMVQGDQFWYSDATASEIFEMLVIVGNAETAKAERRNTCPNDAVPVGICVMEDVARPAGCGVGGRCCQATWLFRHDVIDGWRALRYLCGTVLGSKSLTLDRLYSRVDSKAVPSALSKAFQPFIDCATPVCFAPIALQKVMQVAMVNSTGTRRKFYCHAICGIERLKTLGLQRGTGTLTSTLTACILDAFFTAEPTKKHANVASNVLFDATSPEGNHMCLKVACIARHGFSMQKTAQILRSTGQKVADLWLAALSRQYVMGKMPESVNSFLDSRQKGLDFLVSSLPAYDRTSPPVLDLKVSREFTEWAPSIVYALGIGENLYLDFYWEVLHSFDEDAFCERLSELLETTEIHNRLPEAY
ncbi:hypothetical protein AB1Y20_018517 [Prymnesium parvum]|uniref:Uncharacterized protein n=1 Tax=Prymnesium parvum TaxID=97485 RepID=A0AB34JNZ6_PRYPA